jgi:uncharacterized membrane protein
VTGVGAEATSGAGKVTWRWAYAALLAAVVFAFCAALLPDWYGSGTVSSDAQGYGVIAANIVHGEVPYRDFQVVYPPGALPLFLAPTVVAGTSDEHAYARWFARLMGLVGVLLVACVAIMRPTRAGLVLLAFMPLLLGELVVRRFDLWPALLVAAGVASLLGDRHRLGFGLLGAAFTVKLYPLLLLPVGAVWTYRRRGRGELVRAACWWAAVVVVVFAPFAILGPRGFADSLWREVSRPIQIESLVASFLTTFGHPGVAPGYGSVNIVGHAWLGAIGVGIGLAILVALWVGFARGEANEERFVRYLAACLCTCVAFAKVLSPQYLIWLLPVIPLVRGRRGLAAVTLLAAALVATQIWQPAATYQRYTMAAHGYELAWLVLLRNVVLVALVAVVAWPALRRPAQPPM